MIKPRPVDASGSCSERCAADGLRCRVAWATLRAFYACTEPAMISCHSSGRRCRRSNASAMRARADPSLVSMLVPSSATQNSSTSGVPSLPSRRPCSEPGSVFSAGAWLSGVMKVRPVRRKFEELALLLPDQAVRGRGQR